MSREVEAALLFIRLRLSEIGACLFELGLCLNTRGLIICEVALGVTQLRVEIVMLESSDDLARLHSRAGVNAKIFQPAGNLRTNCRAAIGDDVPGCGKNR